MKSILLIDDSPADIQLLSELLKPSYKVRAAKTPTRALEILDKVQPDLIILDVLMPGMDGYELCARIKQDDHTKSIPVLFVTGNVTDEEKHRGFAAGGAGYLNKPIDPERLLSTILFHMP